MNNKHDIKKDDFYCNDCNKKYKTLWEHNKKFHNKLSTNINQISTNIHNIKKYKCKYCDKSYDFIQSRWKLFCMEL